MYNEYYGVASTPTSDFLAHYGVLGMKWGIRKAAKKGTTYSYKSHSTKKYEKLAKKLAAKGKTDKAKKMANRAKRSAEVDKGEEEYARGLKTRDAVALTMLGGGGSLKSYAQHRAMSGQKGKNATGKKILAGYEAAGDIGAMGSRFRKAGYIRQDEKRKGLNAKGRALYEGLRNDVGEGFDPIANAYNKNKKKRR